MNKPLFFWNFKQNCSNQKNRILIEKYILIKERISSRQVKIVNGKYLPFPAKPPSLHRRNCQAHLRQEIRYSYLHKLYDYLHAKQPFQTRFKIFFYYS